MAPGSFPPGTPTDPDVRNKRTRLLKPSQAGLKRRNLQLFVGTGAWTDRPVRAELRDHVAEELADSDGVFVLDGSGFPKVVLRPVVQIQQQFAHVRVARLIRLPPLVEAVHDEVAGHLRGGDVQAQLLRKRASVFSTECNQVIRATCVGPTRRRWSSDGKAADSLAAKPASQIERA